MGIQQQGKRSYVPEVHTVPPRATDESTSGCEHAGGAERCAARRAAQQDPVTACCEWKHGLDCMYDPKAQPCGHHLDALNPIRSLSTSTTTLGVRTACWTILAPPLTPSRPPFPTRQRGSGGTSATSRARVGPSPTSAAESCCSTSPTSSSSLGRLHSDRESRAASRFWTSPLYRIANARQGIIISICAL